MQNLKLAFYIGKKSRNPHATLLDRVICLFTRSSYSHVELIYNLDQDSRVARCWSSSPRDGGVRHTIITINPDHWDIFNVEGHIATPELHSWFNKYDGKKYDWIGAIGVKFKILKHHNDKWFCSEILAHYFGLKRPHRQSPIKLKSAMKARLTKIDLRKPPPLPLITMLDDRVS